MEQMNEIQSTDNLDPMCMPASRQLNAETWQSPSSPSYEQLIERERTEQRFAELQERAKLRIELAALRKEMKQRNAELEQLRKSNALMEYKLLMMDKDESARVSELFKAVDELQQQRENLAELKELQQIVTCSICMAARCTLAFQCGHLLCALCSYRLDQCHICRLPVARRTVVFL